MLWISQQLYLEDASPELLDELRALPEVVSVEPDEMVPLVLPQVETDEIDSRAWGLEQIQVQQAWAQGHTGEEIVVGILDTGVRQSHEALREKECKAAIKDTIQFYARVKNIQFLFFCFVRNYS